MNLIVLLLMSTITSCPVHVRVTQLGRLVYDQRLEAFGHDRRAVNLAGQNDVVISVASRECGFSYTSPVATLRRALRVEMTVGEKPETVVVR